MDTFEIVSAVVTAIAVYLTARQNIFCWPLSLISVALYAVVFFDARLYADMGLQIIYGGFAVYGWWAWLHGGVDDTPLEVARVPVRQGVAAVAVGAAGTILLATLLTRYTNAAVPWADSALTCFSLVAQWLTARKYIEAWPLWVALDVFYVWLFVSRELIPTSILYGGFIVLALYGWWQWERSRRSAPLREPIPA